MAGSLTGEIVLYSLPDSFRPDRVTPETKAINAALAARLALIPPTADLEQARGMFARGEGAIPASPQSPAARIVTIPGKVGQLHLRIVGPAKPRGIYLHIHGGCWMLGTADMWDDQFERLAAVAGMACVSVEYRLAPEHPFPAAVDDCETAALWLLESAQSYFGTSRLTIGGESAGAHLAVLTLLRLRERRFHRAFLAANLLYGIYDLSLTPSARAAETSLVLDRAVLESSSLYFRERRDERDPAVSPMFADLTDLPPALFTVGTLDPLLDDSLFMHMRWMAAGNRSDLAIYPGGLHGFTSLGGELAEEGNARADGFLKEAIEICE